MLVSFPCSTTPLQLPIVLSPKNPPKSAQKSVLEVLDADSDNIISSDEVNEIIDLAEEEEEGDKGEEGGIDKEDFSSCNP